MSRGPLALLLGALVACSGADAGPRPSVILISWDTVRADHLSLHGYEVRTSPHLEALAEEGITFESAYTTAPWTLPAHMSMLTGLYPGQHGVAGREQSLAPSVASLAERLGGAGYHCVGTYFSGWVDPRHGFDRGFEVFRPHIDGEDAARVVDGFVAAAPPDRPLFLFAHLFDAHNANLQAPGAIPYDPPGDWENRFDAGARAVLRKYSAQGVWRGQETLDARARDALVAAYDGGVAYLDHLLGRWLDSWRVSGLLDRALVVVTADHGEALGQRDGGWAGHGKMYEEGLRVPLVLRLPGGAQSGRREPAVASLVDLVPTVLEVCGLAADPDLPGRSLLAPLGDGPRLLAQQPTWMVARHGDLKFVVPRGSGDAVRTLAFDLAADGGEERALDLGTHAEAAARLVQLEETLLSPASELLQPRAPAGRATLTAEERARLRAIGY